MSPAPVRVWHAGPLPRDVVGPLDRLARAEDAARVAVMPDVHFAEGVCVGVVLATRSLLYPEAVGTDLGCGMATVRLVGEPDVLRDPGVAGRVLVALARAVPGNRHGGAGLRERLPEPLDAMPLSTPSLDTVRRRDARVEFATLGRGNHFLEVQRDEEGRAWLCVHSGSRALGRAILLAHLRTARRTATGLVALEAEHPAGKAYLQDLSFAVAYAEASRRAMAEAAASVLAEEAGWSSEPETFFSCVHNHVRRERHGGEDLWVHRKGAVSAAAGERAIVPGSMGDPTFHVEGKGCPEALSSCAHGAGRAMGRAEARRRIRPRDFLRRMGGVAFDERRARDLVAEAPQAYKDVREAMRAQHDLVRVVRRLVPLLCHKGA